MSTKAVLDNFKTSLEANLNTVLTDKGLIPVEKFIIGNLRTKLNRPCLCGALQQMLMTIWMMK